MTCPVCQQPKHRCDCVRTPTQPAPLLTAEDAETVIWIVSGFRNMARGKRADDLQIPRLQALADGRTVNVRVMSEDEQRTAFYEFIDDWMRVNKSYPSGIDCWLACARAMGAVR